MTISFQRQDYGEITKYMISNKCQCLTKNIGHLADSANFEHDNI